jgi:hypothetical protein
MMKLWGIDLGGSLLKTYFYAFLGPLFLSVALTLVSGLFLLYSYSQYEGVDYSYLLYNSMVPNLFAGVMISFLCLFLFSLAMIRSFLVSGSLKERLFHSRKTTVLAVFLIPIVCEVFLLGVQFSDLTDFEPCSRHYSLVDAFGVLLLSFSAILAGLMVFFAAVHSIQRSKAFDNEQINRLLILLLVSSIVFICSSMWVILISSPGMCDPVVTGFVKFRLDPGSVIYLTNGSYRASLRNELGLPVTVKAISAQETILGENCSMEAHGSGGGNKVSPSSPLIIKGVCPEKSDGESFDLVVNFNYTYSMDGKDQSHIDTGHIKGAAGY